MHSMSPIDWALRPLKKYADFSGRASRAEFWWFFLMMMLFYIAMWVIFAVLIGSRAAGSQPSIAMAGVAGVFAMVIGLIYLAMLIPIIAVQVRRLHDTDRSGWWVGAFWILYLVYLGFLVSRIFSALAVGAPPPLYGAGAFGFLALAMFIYSIVLLVFFCLRGTHGANRFGEDPYGANVEEVFA